MASPHPSFVPCPLALFIQFIRTASDLFRLVPFSVFIIVPGAELLLPVVIRFFPGILPSQFQEAKSRDDRLKAQLVVKLEMAKFLQQTVTDMAVASSKKSSSKSKDLEEFAMLLREGLKPGTSIPTNEVLRFSKLFQDELTLDNLSRPQLQALCRLLQLQPYVGNVGWGKASLRFILVFFFFFCFSLSQDRYGQSTALSAAHEAATVEAR